MFGSGSEEAGRRGFSDCVVGGVVISTGFCSTGFATAGFFLAEIGLATVRGDGFGACAVFDLLTVETCVRQAASSI
jgi:hypothetical protein